MLRRTVFAIAMLGATCASAQASGHGGDWKLDPPLLARAHAPQGESRVIVQTTDRSPADDLIRSLHGRPGRFLTALGGQVAVIPDSALDDLSSRAIVRGVSLDRHVRGTMERTSATVGATWVRDNLRIDGSGVGIAIIDSGVTSWHDDLGSGRVVHFADFVTYQPSPYDDYGHGTHVAGILAGNGYDSGGARRGIAPGASLVVLKVLDGTGDGYISNVIAAMDYAIEHRVQFNIRVINLSVAAGVHESYNTDPLTLAARRAVEAGIVVVTAAGNFGRNPKGQPQYGGVTAPGNAPWVLTVGASSHNGTITRSDDTIAPFSSRGPSYIDYGAKPDIVAPGVGIESLADSSSLLFGTHASARLWGTVDTAAQPYLSLSGTSMSAPVVAGTIALMLEANRSLTPNLVKAILQYTAEERPKYDNLTEGAGFLNARGAVQLAQFLAAGPGAAPVKDDPTGPRWSRHIIWGNHRIGGGTFKPDASAWRTDVMWGSSTTREGNNIVWGTATTGDSVVWGTACANDGCGSIVWGSGADDINIVWGAVCGGADCESVVWEPDCSKTDPLPCQDGSPAAAAAAGEELDRTWAMSCETLSPSCEDVVWRAAGTPPPTLRSRSAREAMAVSSNHSPR